ncbi:MAG: GNAT family N-acetyltransferase [Gemmatimonadetes bacterium]|nr:MAG: GNAT family N-acetyltransferase [Gemmatimonadota bacterium]
MSDYHINIFYDDAARVYVADIPDLPNCSATGSTPADALANVERKKQAWLNTAKAQNLPLPPPVYRPSRYTLEIVPAREEHLPAVIPIWQEFMAYHAEIDPYFAPKPRGEVEFETHLKTLIHAPQAHVLVAVDRDQVVGYAIAEIYHYSPVFAHQQYGFISEVAISQPSRGRGIGQKLVARIYDWFREHEIERVELRVFSANRSAYQFWQKQGFQPYLEVMYRNLQPEK